MQVLNRTEAKEWAQSHGIAYDPKHGWHFDGFSGQFAIEVGPGAIRSVVLAYVILMSLLDNDEEESYQGGLLWHEDWSIWSETIDRVGNYIAEAIRRSEGCSQLLQDAPASLFDGSDFVVAHSSLVLPLIFQWDACYTPKNGAFVVDISHGGRCVIRSRDSGIHRLLLARFEAGEWSPQELGRTNED